MLTLEDIKQAVKKIGPYIHRTPLIHSRSFSELFDASVYLKAENLQKTGSFKVRGAFNKLLSLKNKKAVITASMGNHAQAVAHAATTLGIKSKVIMPITAPIIKEEATRSYGAEVELYGESFSEALSYALSQVQYEFIHAFDDKEIIAGQGTIGIEIIEDLKEVDSILVPVGGGGLISGIALAVKTLLPDTEIIGIQTEKAQSGFLSLRKTEPVEMKPLQTIADGIAVGKIGVLPLELMNKYVDNVLTVKEDSIAQAILFLMERKKLVVEGAGAVTLACLLENPDRFRRKNVVLILSGGNIDFTLMDRILHRGLLANYRTGVIRIIVEDSPLSLMDVSETIGKLRANILNISYNRFIDGLPLGKTEVELTLEIKNREHMFNILSLLKEKGITVKEQ
ncbi:MAG: threonine ammonia-lyase [Thermodesulfovibrionales bacterium]|nr:threonine ammonia-lyase [Thermodesulfovibrionales bacterium]